MTGDRALDISVFVNEFNEFFEAPEAEGAAVNNYLHGFTELPCFLRLVLYIS